MFPVHTQADLDFLPAIGAISIYISIFKELLQQEEQGMYLDKTDNLTEASTSYVLKINFWVYYFHNTVVKKHRISTTNQGHRRGSLAQPERERK